LIALKLRKPVFFALLVSTVLSGCALTREPTRTPRTAMEQLLLAQAITRSLNHLAVPIPSRQPVVVELAGFPQDRSILQRTFAVPQAPTTSPGDLPVIRQQASDLPVVQGKLEARLGELGLMLRTRREEARYFLRAVVEALGTEQGETFFGMPPVQSVLIPFALPELTLYKAQRQRAYARFTIDVYDAHTGELVRSTSWYEGAAFYNQYTVFFFFTFEGSDLTAIP
jgi:hypothetical protein